VSVAFEHLIMTSNFSKQYNSYATASFVPWRTTLVKDASNEVYVNIVEELDACVNRYVDISPFLH
jgi:hypothetical protein